MGDCSDCEEITSAILTSNNDDDKIECDEDIKVKIDFGTDVLAPVELVMIDKDGNYEFIGMTPTVSTPATAIDLTTDKFSQWEVNITRDGALNWVDVSSDNTITLTVSNSCYVGTDVLEYDLLGDCSDSSTATSTVSYQVRSTDLVTYVTQTPDNYGKVYCGDVLKFNVTLPTSHNGSVHLKLAYSDGTNDDISLVPVGGLPTSDWTIDGISLAEGKYGDVATLTILDYTTLDEEVLPSDLVLDYQEGLGCIDESFTTISTIYNIGVNAPSSSDYSMNGNDLNGTVTGNDPSLTFNVGDTINFNVDSPGHPFYLKTVASTGTGDLISGVTNNGATEDTVTWIPSTPGIYYYQCSLHSGMTGTITIL